jgi:NAD(P)-dependent dehydrogenase (short-subunit alcohol dehydrogenase family)
MFDLNGKAAIVTGAASGIGRAAAVLFAKAGANVVIADLNVSDGQAAAELASKSGRRAIFVRTDVSREADIESLVSSCMEAFGRLDVMFNNAGVSGAQGSLEKIAVEDWDRTLNVCLRSVFLGIKHAVGPMRANGGGAIISTASGAAVQGYNGIHGYCAAKAGVVNLTRSASLEYACDNIRINAISPGGISTPMVYVAMGGKDFADAHLLDAQPLPRVGQPEDIANAALFLASDAASFITGQNLIVDGGATAGVVSTARRADRPTPFSGQRAFAGPSFEAP